MKVWLNQPELITYIGWNDGRRAVMTDFDLGRGVLPKQKFGLRRAVYDIAFGYVSGFQKRDILYYVLTRSLSRRVWKRVLARNDRRGDNKYPMSSLDLSDRQHCIDTGRSY